MLWTLSNVLHAVHASQELAKAVGRWRLLYIKYCQGRNGLTLAPEAKAVQILGMKGDHSVEVAFITAAEVVVEGEEWLPLYDLGPMDNNQPVDYYKNTTFSREMRSMSQRVVIPLHDLRDESDTEERYAEWRRLQDEAEAREAREKRKAELQAELEELESETRVAERQTRQV